MTIYTVEALGGAKMVELSEYERLATELATTREALSELSAAALAITGDLSKMLAYHEAVPPHEGSWPDLARLYRVALAASQCDDDHHAMMNGPRIAQSLPADYTQALINASKPKDQS